MSHPRRLWLRHSVGAAGWTLGLLVCLVAAIALGGQGDGVLALVAAGVGLGCLVIAWREQRMAGRARVGARSEQLVRAALSSLERAGWAVRHSVRWPEGGDIDHVATAPSGAAFVIETKTCGFSSEHLARTRACALWVARRRRRWAPCGAWAVLCVAHGRARCETVDGVLVVSVDRLAGVLRSVAKGEKPAAAIWPGGIAEERVV